MNYRRPTNEPYWHHHGSAQQSAYQRGTGNDFAPSSNFDLDDFIPYNGIGRRPPQQQSLGYHYNPPAFQGTPMENPQGFRRFGDTYQDFNSSPGAWVQPPAHGHPARPPVFHDGQSGDQLHYRVVDGRSILGPAEETRQQLRGLLQNPQVEEPQVQQEWQATTLQPQPQELHPNPMEILPSTEDPPPTQPSPQKNRRKEPPAPPGVSGFTCTETNRAASDKPPMSPTNDSPNDPLPPPDLTEKKSNSYDDSVILHPTMKVPVKRKPNGTYELVEDEEPKQNLPPKRPKKLPEEVGEGCYCELCDLACSGPLNLRMHISGAKHKLNEAKVMKGEKTIVRKNLSRKIRDRFISGSTIPDGHNQEETPIIGLDFVTRIVCPDKDESEDLFECSLCDKKDLMAKCIYSHVLGRAHRKAYIRKLKPDLADQYSNVANVYNQSGQLQRRQNSDLTALLNNIIKIAAKRDGPGEMQLRLWNEDDGGETEDFGLKGYNSEPEEGDELSFGNRNDGGRPQGITQFEGNPHLPKMPAIPRPPYRTADFPALPPLSSGDSLPPLPPPTSAPPPVTRLLPLNASPETLHSPQEPGKNPPITRLPSRIMSPERVPRRTPNQSSVATRLSPPAVTTGLGPTLTRIPSKSQPPPPPSKDGSQTTIKQISPADLPPLTDDQLRFYCSDVFIAQEYRRRFGELASQQRLEKETSTSIGTVQPSETTFKSMLKTLSDIMVCSEDDANMAMELTRALTQATLKYRLREKNYACQGKSGQR